MKNYIKALERILILEDRIKAIEKKQAERFPMLVEKLDRIEGSLKRTTGRTGRIENSFPAIVDRLNRLEKKLATSFKISCKRIDGLEDDTHTHLSLIHISEPTRPY